MQEFQKGNIYQDRTIPMMRKLCLAFLLNFAEEASWAELAFRGGLYDQKNKKGRVLF